MLTHSVPVYYFPTTVVFIGDNRSFLENFISEIGEIFGFNSTNSPRRALHWVKQNANQFERLKERCLSEYTDSTVWPITNQTVNFNLSEIHKEVYNPNRFQAVSIILVDNMASMDELALCKQLGNTCVKRILLTDSHNHELAISAFNEGIIERFIRKSAPGLNQRVKECIQTLQKQFFLNISDTLLDLLSVNGLTCLRDKTFHTFFNTLCRDKQITEFYLTENSGNFLLLDVKGRPSYLIVKDEQDLKLICDHAKDNNAPRRALKELSQGTKLPYFWKLNNPEKAEWNNWDELLFPASTLLGQRLFYYSYIDGEKALKLLNKPIYSYRKHLEKTRQKSKLFLLDNT